MCKTRPYGEGERGLEEGGGFAYDYFFGVLVFGPDVEADGAAISFGNFCVVGEGVAVPDGGDELGCEGAAFDPAPGVWEPAGDEDGEESLGEDALSDGLLLHGLSGGLSVGVEAGFPIAAGGDSFEELFVGDDHLLGDGAGEGGESIAYLNG